MKTSGRTSERDENTRIIPSIRRSSIIAACLDMANLMERGGTGFQTKGVSDSQKKEIANNML